MFWNTFVIAVPRTLLAIVLAASFAWILARTNVPFRGLIIASLTFLFFLPDLPWIIAWMMMGAARVGLLNKWLSFFLGTRIDWINVLPACRDLVILGAARTVPILFLLSLSGVPVAMDSSLEESARVSGANRWKTLWRINFPLVKACAVRGFHSCLRAFDGKF